MAQKRMFSMKIVDSDAFLDMPLSAQCLYFHLNMRADDDGFIGNPKKIMRMIGSSEDDLKLLIAKRFLIIFENNIVVIKHWWMHNTLTKDRYSETSYRDEKMLLNLKENKSYTLDPNYSDHPAIEERKKEPVNYSDARLKRIQAIKESDLPTHFNRSISNAFHNELCPVCNVKMDVYDTQSRPTVQHNVPISLGGKHELNNVSVICQSCNCSLNNKETPAYNTDEVIRRWNRIQNSTECIGNVNTDIDKNLDIDKELNLNTHTNLNNSVCEKNFSPAENDLTDSQKNYAREIFELWSQNNLPCCNNNYISFIQSDFYRALPDIRCYHSADVIQACKNYISILKDSSCWVTKELSFDCFVSSKLFIGCLPKNFRQINYLKNETKQDYTPDNKYKKSLENKIQLEEN